jgi:hypothetical protein
MQLYCRLSFREFAVQDNLLSVLYETVPALVAGADEASKLQAEIDRIDQSIADGMEENYFDHPSVIGFDPTVISSRPRSQVTRDLTSSLPKGVKGLVKRYLRERNNALADVISNQ